MGILENNRHEAFVKEYIKNENNATDAYIKAGYKSSGESARRLASKLLTNVDIQTRLSELQTKLDKDYDLSIERRMRDLEKALKETEANSDMTNRLKIMDMFNKMAGGYTENVNNNTKIEGGLDINVTYD